MKMKTRHALFFLLCFFVANVCGNAIDDDGKIVESSQTPTYDWDAIEFNQTEHNGEMDAGLNETIIPTKKPKPKRPVWWKAS